MCGCKGDTDNGMFFTFYLVGCYLVNEKLVTLLFESGIRIIEWLIEILEKREKGKKV